MTEGLRELVGVECNAEFERYAVPHDLIEGNWVVVDAVDMPLVKVRAIHGGRPVWITAAAIRWIRPTGRSRVAEPSGVDEITTPPLSS